MPRSLLHIRALPPCTRLFPALLVSSLPLGALAICPLPGTASPSGRLSSPVTACGSTQQMRAPGYYLPPKPALPSPGSPRAGAGNLLDLNTATLEQLTALPGMGRVYAQRVLAGRPYHAKNQLVRRGILPASAYERIAGYVTAHRATAVPPKVVAAGVAR